MRDPWKSFGALDPVETYVVLASSIPARTLAATPALFRGSRAVKRQLVDAAGLKGFSLLARPLRKQYATLSVWTSDEALEAFARSKPHCELMSKLAAEMASTTFVRWTIVGRDGRPRWRDALSRLADADASSRDGRQ